MKMRRKEGRYECDKRWIDAYLALDKDCARCTPRCHWYTCYPLLRSLSDTNNSELCQSGRWEAVAEVGDIFGCGRKRSPKPFYFVRSLLTVDKSSQD